MGWLLAISLFTNAAAFAYIIFIKRYIRELKESNEEHLHINASLQALNFHLVEFIQRSKIKIVKKKYRSPEAEAIIDDIIERFGDKNNEFNSRTDHRDRIAK